MDERGNKELTISENRDYIILLLIINLNCQAADRGNILTAIVYVTAFLLIRLLYQQDLCHHNTIQYNKYNAEMYSDNGTKT